MTVDPTPLLRLRDGVYAADLLVVAIAELDLFTRLAGRGAVAEARLREEIGAAARPFDVLLTYCAALGLVDRRDTTVRATDLAVVHAADGPASLRPYFASLAERPACAELLRVLRTGEPAAWASALPATGAGPEPDWAGRLDDPAFAESITAAMDARGAVLGPPMAQALDGVPMSRLLDVAGSSGVYARALLDRRPGLRASVLERPPVDRAARTLVARSPHAGALDVVTGDMLADPLPEGYDAHLYSHVLHDWDAERVTRLLAASFRALPPGGVLVDHDAHLDEDGCGPLAVAEYSVLLMHSTWGKCWSVRELREMGEAAGFVDVTHRPCTPDRSVVVLRKPA